MPRLLAVLAVVGTAAMLWVGGHILLVGVDELGWHGPYELVHHLEEAARDATGALGGLVPWLVNTLASALIGVVVGAVVVLAVTLLMRRRTTPAH
jgi:predicted DNA repair protein MutK